MSKADEYLESKKYRCEMIKGYVTSLEHAKTYGKIVELEVQLKQCFEWEFEDIKHLESEIDKLMKL